MPKPSYRHTKDAMSTDNKFRPEDEAVYREEKRDFQESEKTKKSSGGEDTEPARPAEHDEEAK